VALDVHGPDEVRAAYERMRHQLGTAMVPAVVQRMAAGGADVAVGAHQDPSYGTVVGVGLGGSVAAANPRRSRRVAPLTDAVAARLVGVAPVGGLLAADAGGRGDEAGGPVTGSGSDGLEALLVRLTWVLEQLPAVAEVELDPVLVAGPVVSITAGRVQIAPPSWLLPPDVRRLS
jgi:hypothetical protein